MSSRTGRHTSRHRRQGALHAGADTVQLQQHFNRSIPFYMLLNDTRVFVKQSRAGISGQGLPGGWQSALSPHDVHRSGCQCSTIIIYSSGRRSVFRQTRQPNLSGLLLSTLSSPPRYLVTCRLAILLAFKFEFFSWAYEEKIESRTKVSLCQRPKNSRSALRTLFWNQSWVRLRSCFILEDQPESALRKLQTSKLLLLYSIVFENSWSM